LADISGDNIARKLRNDSATNSIPIILFSGLNTLEKIAESTGTDFIKKPFDIEELKQKVRIHLRQNLATENASFFGRGMLHYKSPELPL
jgi:DNA-binding response OmpR family regulator